MLGQSCLLSVSEHAIVAPAVQSVPADQETCDPQVGLLVWVLLIAYYLGRAMRRLHKRPYPAFRRAEQQLQKSSALPHESCCLYHLTDANGVAG